MDYKQTITNTDLTGRINDFISVTNRVHQRFSEHTDDITEFVPALLWASDSECECAVSQLCNYLSEENIINFEGDRKHICLNLDYMDAGKSVTTNCNRIGDVLRIAKGYRERFVGMIVIDTQAVKRFNTDFIRIMQFIKNHTHGCIYCILDRMRKNVAEVEYALVKASYRVFTLTDKKINANIAYEFVDNMLKDYGFVINNKAGVYIRGMIEQLVEEERILYIYQLEELCKDIVFYLLGLGCHELISDKNMGDYFRQCGLWNDCSYRKRSIGFITEKRGEKNDYTVGRQVC